MTKIGTTAVIGAGLGPSSLPYKCRAESRQVQNGRESRVCCGRKGRKGSVVEMVIYVTAKSGAQMEESAAKGLQGS